MKSIEYQLIDTIKDAELINDYEFASRLHEAGLNNSLNSSYGTIEMIFFDVYDLSF